MPLIFKDELMLIDEELARRLATDYNQYEKLVAPLYERTEENLHEPECPEIR